MNNGLEQSRFGFVVSLKVSKKAVVRNKIKRRFAEIIKANKEKIRNGVDLVLIALPGTEKKDFSEVKNCVDEVFTKAKLIKNNV